MWNGPSLWNIGEDFEKVERTLRELVAADQRILKDPEPTFALLSLAASSVERGCSRLGADG